MSFEPGNYGLTGIPDQIEYFKSIKGNLSEEQARIEVYKFFRSNLRIAAYTLLGIDLYMIQEIVLKMMFNKDFVLGICTRGFSKTTLGGIFAGLYGAMEPGNKILLLGPSFKQSKLIFEHIEKLSEQPGGALFRECFKSNISHKNDEWSVEIGLPGMTSIIKALPLGMGDKIRGFRANVLVLDELREIPTDIVKEVLKPFLIVSKDPRKKTKIIQLEDKLIKAGKMKESERTKFKKPKIIGLSSASYRFEDLSKTFDQYVEAILDPTKKGESTYGVFQISCDALEKGYIEEEFLKENRETMSESQFLREFGAQFTDDSSGYFRMAQMEDCTLKIGSSPTIQFQGQKGAAYILAIDPNYKENETSDHFAMCLVQLDETGKKGYVVHSYAVAGLTLKEHIRYIHYLLTNFNVIYIIIDSMGAEQVISFANENDLFKASNINLKTFEAEYDNAEKIRAAKRTYDKSSWTIVHKQNFTSEWIANANQWLQGNFQHRRIFFAANLDTEAYESTARNTANSIPLEQIVFDSDDPEYSDSTEKMIEFIDTQSRLIKLTKDECALIEVDITPLGTQTFRLPQNIRRGKGKNRARKDSYTALLLANWGIKCWGYLIETPEDNTATFTPIALPM